MASLQPSVRPRPAGFTLLELLVVLAVVAMAAGLVVPGAVRGLEAARERMARNELRAVLSSLPLRAFQSGGALEIDEARLGELMDSWPDTLRVTFSRPLRYAANGMAEGGEVQLKRDADLVLQLTIEPVTGRVLEGRRP